MSFKRRLIYAGLLAALVGLGVAAKPAYRAFREQMMDRVLEEAKLAGSRGDWGTAREKARSVLLVRQTDFAAFRIWARALGKVDDPRSYLAAAQLFSSSRATREDRLEAIQILVRRAPHAVALSAYASLPEELFKEASFRAAINPLLVQRGELDLAESGLRESALPASEPVVRLELLRVLCARPDAARVSEARGIFAELIASGAAEEALAALVILGDTPGGLAPGEPLPDLPKWLESQPAATAIHHLLSLHPALEVQPETAERLYQDAIKRFLPKEPGVLGTWLVRRGKAALAAAALETPATTDEDAFISRLHALLRLQRDSEFAALLAEPPAAVDEVDLEIIRATMAWRRGEQAVSETAWTQAMNQAALDQSRNRFIDIARAAAACGAAAAAEDAWVAAVRTGWGQLPRNRRRIA